MRPIAWLLRIVAFLLTVNANVEKTIFLGPSAVSLPNAHPNLNDLYLETLEPAELSILAKQLRVHFPTHSAPRGLASWYILRGLKERQRYEQPTDFWLDTFHITEVFDTPDLISSLAEYSEQRQTSQLQTQGYIADGSATAQSILLLRIQAAASYYSTNKTLMAYPSPVDVDIILDPFILNILPRSLGPTAIYITIVAVGAWFISGGIYRWLLAVSDEFEEKVHKE
ncbi:hypothetical protein N0V90_011077 [Kalmusia sp. IMI 367209]|nr:hypothetical protein N0V90_011077 [Kalmusia sp. IMI 367209]